LVFPEQISADVNRNIDVFVSLVDSDGLPAVTPVDVKLELFSDEDAVGRNLDERMKKTNVVIKTGEFGYYFREKMNLAGFEGREIMIGVSSKDLGIALDQFKAVKPLNINVCVLSVVGSPIFNNNRQVVLVDPGPEIYQNKAGYNDSVRNIVLNYCGNIGQDIAMKYLYLKADIQVAQHDSGTLSSFQN